MTRDNATYLKEARLKKGNQTVLFVLIGMKERMKNAKYGLFHD